MGAESPFADVVLEVLMGLFSRKTDKEINRRTENSNGTQKNRGLSEV